MTLVVRVCLAAVVLVAGVGLLLTYCRNHGQPQSQQRKVEPQSPQYIRAETSWIGNTFGHKGDKWVQMDAQGLYVAPDGTVFTNSFWDEGGKEVGIYREGDALGQLGATHGWGRLGGYAVTANSKYVYMTMRQGDKVSPKAGYPPKGTTWYGVRRYRNDGTGSSAPFARGAGYDDSMLIINSLTNGTADVRGLAVDGEDRLYVSDDHEGLIRVYDAETMTSITSWPLPRPRQLAVDEDGSLWVIQEGDGNVGPKILHYSKDGTRLSQQITGVTAPTALAVDDRGRLLVADNGPDQQIKIYDGLETTPELVDTLGERGGIFGGMPGEVGPLRFGGLIGVGSDAAGNVYVGYNGIGPTVDPENRGTGLVLQSYSPARRLNWELLGLEFVDNADADPSSEAQDVYTKEEHFEIDLNEPPGRQWSYAGSTLNPLKYPEDPRLHIRKHPTAPLFRRIEGEPFLFVTDMYSTFLQVYRFDPATDGEVAIPSGLFATQHYSGVWPPHQPSVGEWIWRDKDGDGAFGPAEYDVSKPSSTKSLWGWWVDDRGNVWQANRRDGIRRFPLQGLDAHGNPIYTYASMQTVPAPTPFNGSGGDLQRIEYDSENDVMYLAGYTSAHPNPKNVNPHGDWGKVGTVVARYDDWSRGTRMPRWKIAPLPYDNSNGVLPKAMSVAGDKLFVAYARMGEVHVYDAETGESQGIISPGPEVDSLSGWIDIPYGVRARQRSGGEYVIFVEEDGYAKVMMYLWDGETANNQVRVDDADSAINYEGSWSTLTVSPQEPAKQATHNGTLHQTSVAGASAEYTFFGSSITVRGRRSPNSQGTADVFIDGQFQKTISYHYPSGGDSRVVFSTERLSSRRHSIKIVCNGDGPVNIDAFQYDSSMS